MVYTIIFNTRSEISCLKVAMHLRLGCGQEMTSISALCFVLLIVKAPMEYKPFAFATKGAIFIIGSLRNNDGDVEDDA